MREEFVSHPRVIDEGADWQLLHLPTHKAQFYDVHRFEFEDSVSSTTDGSCHVLSLVEGSEIELKTAGGLASASTMLKHLLFQPPPAVTASINKGETPAKVVKAFIKNSHEQAPGVCQMTYVLGHRRRWHKNLCKHNFHLRADSRRGNLWSI